MLRDHLDQGVGTGVTEMDGGDILGGYKSVLKLKCVDSCRILEICLKPLNCTLKRVNFMVYKLYLNIKANQQFSLRNHHKFSFQSYLPIILCC